MMSTSIVRCLPVMTDTVLVRRNCFLFTSLFDDLLSLGLYYKGPNTTITYFLPHLNRPSQISRKQMQLITVIKYFRNMVNSQ